MLSVAVFCSALHGVAFYVAVCCSVPCGVLHT